MLTKHFFKTLIIFSAMIALGLLGIFLTSYFDLADETTGVKVEVAN